MNKETMEIIKYANKMFIKIKKLAGYLMGIQMRMMAFLDILKIVYLM